jgi:hypothetical protein
MLGQADKPPSGAYVDYGAAIDFLSIIMIPLKKIGNFELFTTRAEEARSLLGLQW